MNRLLIISILLVLGACSTNKDAQETEEKTHIEPTNIVSENYELIIPKKQDGFLILFPCFPCDAENTRTEFNIVDIASSNNITILLMNFNQHLWLSETEKEDLEEIIVNAVKQNDINTDNTYIGGFSSGGNVSLLLADYLKSTKSTIQPKGLFIADSPIDLLGLYENAQKNIEKNFSEPAVQEANWIVEMFDPEFGTGEAGLINYENKSPYFSKTNSIKNLSNLSDVKIRLYSEPDTLWWRENRQAEYEDMNAYYIEQLADDLTKLYGESQVTFIRTKNRGYRANGDRHPHSWAIIDEQGLIDWIKAN
ncbi:MAG: hypothetical protein COA38_19105 [Fluviicola sp.]|nr:MAG: hypothetical protein COA38_19105 [Fluviicola sp.]